jgi:hypothetical protein
VKLEGIQAGDIVLCAIKGRRVYGEVQEVSAGVVRFTPITPAAGWRHAGAREVIGHWRKAGRRGGAADEGSSSEVPREQLSLGIWS